MMSPHRIFATATMAGLLFVLCAVGGCNDDAPQYRSGYLCSCDQRAAVAQYVADNQRHGMADNSHDYVNRLFSVAVVTLCDHRDSVLTRNYGNNAFGLAPCEYWSDDIGPPLP